MKVFLLNTDQKAETATEKVVPHTDLPSVQRLRVALNGITSKCGTNIYLWELASALAKADGVDLTVLIGQGKQTTGIPTALLSRTYPVQISSNRSYVQIFRQTQMREALLGEKIDLYHIPNTMPLFGKVAPTVVTIHDLVDIRIRKYSLPRTAYRFFVNLVTAHVADHVLTVSEHSKRDIVRLLHIPKSKVTVVYNGVSEEFRLLDRQKCKDFLASKYSITGDFLLAPGGLSRNKNVPRLLAAIRLLKERGRVESLVLLGDKEDREFKYAVTAVQQSGLAGTVVLPGFVPREELPAFYNASCLVVYPSLYEGFGFPILEAMACGTPVVTGDNSSLPEIAGGAALLVDSRKPEEIASAAQRLLTDETLRAELSSRGLLRAREFRWEKTARETLKVFLEVRARRQRM
jgi:glycosyltransferase involved in cell wall biosynthesis